MRRMDYKVVIVSIIALCVMVICMSVAYAALSTRLNINFGNVVQIPETWNVGFLTENVPGVAGSNNSSKTVCGNATIMNNTVTVNPKIGGVGDSCSYKVTIKNTGTIDAKIGSVSMLSPEGTLCAYSNISLDLYCDAITYTLTYNSVSSSTYPKIEDTLAAGESKFVVLNVKYASTTTQLTEFAQSGFKFVINYVQNN